MARQRALPSEAFLAKLNGHLAEYLSRMDAAGTKIGRPMLAAQLGYERTTVYKWLRGRQLMPADAIVAFCKLVDLNEEERNELLTLGGYPELAVSTSTPQETDPAPRSETLHRLPSGPSFPIPAATLPAKPKLMIGREADVQAIKSRLGIGAKTVGPIQVLTAMRGWPGVGKTTLASALAYDEDIARAFPNGVLWAALGQKPSLFGELATWGRALGVPDLNQARTIEEASALLRGLLRNQRRLLIVDDVWQAEHVLPFDVGGPGCALLATTRLPEVARRIAPVPDAVYVLGVLEVEDALQLLRTLAPTVVADNEVVSRELVADLERLPLAIQVAGRLLHTEASYGFAVTQLLADIRAGAALIAAQAPADRADVANETTPTVAALLALSTNHLDEETLERFAYLGVFAPKPATFDLTAMQKVWEAADAQPTVRTLVDRGLLEPSDAGRFWMHAILVMHAKSFWEEE